jgi:hypothetical protein
MYWEQLKNRGTPCMPKSQMPMGHDEAQSYLAQPKHDPGTGTFRPQAAHTHSYSWAKGHAWASMSARWICSSTVRNRGPDGRHGPGSLPTTYSRLSLV